MIMRQRRFLPSLSQLLAFDAVVRHRSVTAAATELNLTQSTVSRLTQSLEEQLGTDLFIRQKRRLTPTQAALAYQGDIQRALDMIQRASMSVVANPGGGTISLAVLPTFATRWLGPRLGGFFEAHPGISVNLSTRIQRFSFETEIFDAVIYFGDPDWPDVHHHKLFDEALTACASPGFLDRNPITTPEDMSGVPLLRLENRPESWADWFAGQGGQMNGAEGMVVDQFSMMIQAAISGLGIALLPDYLARIEMAEGRLLPVLDEAVPGSGSYWLAWPEAKASHGALSRFRDWLADQAAGQHPDHMSRKTVSPSP